MPQLSIRPRVDVSYRAKLVLSDPNNAKYKRIIKKYTQKAEKLPEPRLGILGLIKSIFKSDVQHVITIDVNPDAKYIGKVNKYSYPYLKMENMYIRQDKIVDGKAIKGEGKKVLSSNGKHLLDLISLG